MCIVLITVQEIMDYHSNFRGNKDVQMKYIL